MNYNALEKVAQIRSGVTTFDHNVFLAKNIIEDYIEKEKREAKRSGSEADPDKHLLAEKIAPAIRALALIGGGGALGWTLSGGEVPKGFGAYAGALSGLGVSTLGSAIGALSAYITRRRKMKEQIEQDEKSVLMKYLVPGLAEYDYGKRSELAKYDSIVK